MSKRWRAIVPLLVFLFPGCARGGEGSAQAPGSQPMRGAKPAVSQPDAGKRVRVIPWIEVNRGTRAEIDRAVAGLQIWRRVTDTAIVSSTVGKSRMYARLCARVPDMHIIPGLKTAGVCKPFDSLRGWRRIAAEVDLVCRVTGERRLVLENETALCDEEGGSKDSYWDARVTLDFERLRAGLELLPAEVEIWWGPSFVTGTKSRELRHHQSAVLCQLVEDVCDVRFIVAEVAKPPEKSDCWNAELTVMRDRIAQKPSIPIIYTTSWAAYWKTERTVEALRLVSGEDAIIYPGATKWVEAAREITALLLDSDVLEKP